MIVVATPITSILIEMILILINILLVITGHLPLEILMSLLSVVIVVKEKEI